ncbi:hypothetical protein AKJ16_DCAP26214 [Drosera capensis]
MYAQLRIGETTVSFSDFLYYCRGHGLRFTAPAISVSHDICPWANLRSRSGGDHVLDGFLSSYALDEESWVAAPCMLREIGVETKGQGSPSGPYACEDPGSIVV